MESKRVGTVPNLIKKNGRKRVKLNTLNTQIHESSLFWLVTGASIKNG
jgi:hypothetical protein